MLVMANRYNFFILGQPLFQGYYTMHDMAKTTISFAPLENSSKLVPRKSKIPITFIKADNGPGFFETYGSILFLMLCVVFAAYVY